MLILERLGPESRSQRFLGPRSTLSDRDLTFLSGIDTGAHEGVIAFAGSPASPIGAAHYVTTDHPGTAETAIEVVDGWQRRGIGRLLIAKLRVCALQAGIDHFEWLAFESNRAVVALARDFGDAHCSRVGDGVVKYSVAIAKQR
jgi:GNAT superfamily N-acetyltransferase